MFFGATGDLAYKKIFPSRQAMAKRGRLDVPVIGVAKAGWTPRTTSRSRPLFGPVVEQLARSACVKGARVVVENPGGIAGGGDGAAVGALVGGISCVAVASSSQEHLKLPAETRLQFTLTSTVRLQP